jgi:hypothetical protein
MKFRYLLLCALAATALAQPAGTPKVASVEGKVVNALTNEPVRKVEL